MIFPSVRSTSGEMDQFTLPHLAVHQHHGGPQSTSTEDFTNKHLFFSPQNKYGFSQDKWANLLTKWEFKQLTKNV
jgi:hypothetical protein